MKLLKRPHRLSSLIEPRPLPLDKPSYLLEQFVSMRKANGEELTDEQIARLRSRLRGKWK
jgi:hypothetical protein